MDSRLAECESKIERAEEHLNNLYLDIVRFLHPDAYVIVPERDPESGDVLLRVHGPKPKLRLSTIGGDVAHNLRSSLNYLACALVRLNGNSPTDFTEFPIYSNLPKDPTKWNRKVEGMSEAVIADIKRLQPYNRRPSSLELLAQLNNRDKHQMLNLVSATAKQILVRMRYTSGVEIEHTMPRHTILEEGAVIHRVRAPANDTSEMHVDVEVATEITFDQSGPCPTESVLPTLKQLIDCIRGVTLCFEQRHFIPHEGVLPSRG